MRSGFDSRGVAILAALGSLAHQCCCAAEFPVVSQSNVTVRVMAANISSGNNPRYETPGLNILKGLKPDIVAIQEFSVSNGFGINTPAALSNMIATTFGTNFAYFRETGAGYSIPNGIISRWPFVTNGTWDDVQVPDRGFAWAQIDLPGTNDLYVVSVHLHSSGGASSRAIEATNLTALTQSNFPAGAWLIVAGDFNTDNRSEAAISRFKTFLSDEKIPVDQAGDPDTNANRNRPYDYVLPSFSLTNALVPVAIGTNQFTNGLVFDSRAYAPLSDVPPVISTDSGVFQMQHMAVVKEFRIGCSVTNFITVNSPVLTFDPPNILRWQGVSNLTYTVLASTNLTDWDSLGAATSTTSSFSFTNLIGDDAQQFYRVTYP